MTALHLTGRQLGRFELLSELGRGGMGIVYNARQTDLERIVAMKILPPELTHDESYVARFHQEARSAARLEHPNIVPIYEIGTEDGLHYLVMKYVQGETLKEILAREGAMSTAQVLPLLEQVGAALDYAHRHSVIHRDIKPSNIMVTAEGWVYLMDFGLARAIDASKGLTRTGTVMGTPEYMSPEQAQGLSSIGPPTDIYALGVVLYEMLTGTFPFEAETPLGMLSARLVEAPRPPGEVRTDVPPAVEDVVMQALSREPEARYGSVAEMLAALRHAAASQPPAMPANTPPPDTPSRTVVVAKEGTTMHEPPPHQATDGAAPDSAPAGATTTRPRSGKPKWIIAMIVVGIVLAVGALRDRQNSGIVGPSPTPPLIPTLTPIAPDGNEAAAHVQEGWALLDAGDHRAALAAFDQALALEPHLQAEVEAYIGKSQVYLSQSPPHYENALEALETAEALAPDDPTLMTYIGWAYYTRGFEEAVPDDYEEAIEYFEEALELTDERSEEEWLFPPQPIDAYLGIGWSRYNLGDDYEEAAEAFTEATRLDPSSSEAFEGLGYARQELGDIEGAQEAYERVLELDPDNQNIEDDLDRLRYAE